MNEFVLRQTIRQARLAKNFTFEELAELVEVTPVHMQHIEGGHRKPSIELFFKLAEVLQFSVDAMLYQGKLENQETLAKIAVQLNNCSEEELNLISELLATYLNNKNSK